MISQLAFAFWFFVLMGWMDVFHSLVIPFLGGFALTLGKLIADGKLLSFNESNDIALDMVILSVGALGALYIKGGRVEPVIDAGIVDAFVAAILLYVRHRRKRLSDPRSVGPSLGIIQMILGAAAILWTLNAF